MIFINSLQSEWLKTKRSTSFWLAIIGGFFIPLIWLIIFFYKGETINDYPPIPGMWTIHYNSLWQNMVSFLLPMGVILSSSLITQLEYKNNTWKQVHTTPQSFATVYFAKLSAILLLTLQFFVFFNIGILLSAYIPTLVLEGGLPNESLPVWEVIKSNTKIFITILPIIAIQYLISLRFKNFLVSVGIGLLGLIGALIATPVWEHAYLIPYSYSIMNIITPAQANVPGNFYVTAIIFFAVVTGINYFIYINRSEKG
ncbi:MAG: ABC transporter permease [Sphingobacteriales bacterium JAD_PAG50586_3]|nr:MAG: ABC transporter permease [Sphingobacteriales bacterium JAD_PAG50586_3]